MEIDRLIDRAATTGAFLLQLLSELEVAHDVVTDVRGRGLMCAFTLPDKGFRDRVLTQLRNQERVLLLGCGTRSIRFRPALTVSLDELSAGVAALDRVVRSVSEELQ
jgi:L-lysine 6-transaminase